ncbi:hypothetical protein P775_13355 [Puniceibacterium antarcticum]|uniref:HTH tetR-type domain-containing protein n=1 Tax=Puniceibacterium antarcticum TaxID=1206336 RepID=A0A2G8RDL5_9RHOB|nr:TetR/AcrR family transcriptional regulator [Puniceibacterium antarcticum]PIL19676.1 hypothetical protein P775_13355 [Puniceibacterium antarcticum]
MATNLRERRRRQTSREIQMAAVVVTLRCGYEHTTTEAIASEAGISTRTFFNYYNNKEAAILGETTPPDPAQADWFITSDAPIVDDIAHLLGQVLKDDQVDRNMMRKIMDVIETTPDFLPLFRKRMDDTSLVVSNLLVARFGAAFAAEAQLLAELATHAMIDALQVWAVDDNLVVDDVTTLIREKLHNVGTLLSRGGRGALR